MRIVRLIPEWVLGFAAAALCMLAVACYESCSVRGMKRMNSWRANTTGLRCGTDMLTFLAVGGLTSFVAALIVSLELRLS